MIHPKRRPTKKNKNGNNGSIPVRRPVIGGHAYGPGRVQWTSAGPDSRFGISAWGHLLPRNAFLGFIRKFTNPSLVATHASGAVISTLQSSFYLACLVCGECEMQWNVDRLPNFSHRMSCQLKVAFWFLTCIFVDSSKISTVMNGNHSLSCLLHLLPPTWSHNHPIFSMVAWNRVALAERNQMICARLILCHHDSIHHSCIHRHRNHWHSASLAGWRWIIPGCWCCVLCVL